MSRDSLGRFKPGSTGNPHGRPRKAVREISHEQVRKDFFEVDNEEVEINESGVRRKIPLGIAIVKQLAGKAARGDIRAIVEYNKLRNRYVADFVDDQLALMEQCLKSEKLARQMPEDVTDEYLEGIQRARAMLAPGFKY